MPTAPPSSPPPSGPLPRWARRLLWGVGGLLLLLVLLVAGVLVYLSSRAGEERLKGLVLSGAQDALKGELSLGTLELSGTRLLVRDVVLKDPEGVEVARIQEVRATLRLAPLARQAVALSDVALVGPTLHLVQDARGLNLMRALESKGPKPTELPKEGGGGWSVRVDDARLENGALDIRLEEQDLRYSAEGLSARASASWRARKKALEAALTLEGRLTHPTEGPLRLEASATGAGEALRGEVALTLAGLTGRARLEQESATRRTVEVEGLTLPADTARAFLSSWPLAVAVSLQGRLQQAGDVLTPDVTVKAGSATAHLTGEADVEKLRASPLLLEVGGVNLEELLGERTQSGRPLARQLARESATTPLSATLRVEGGGKTFETLEGRLSLSVPPARLSGEPLGPIRVEAEAGGGRVLLEELHAVLPGVVARASGEATQQALDARLRLDAHSLATLARTLQLPQALSGHGQLEAHATGPTFHPGVRASGRFDSLRYEDTTVEGLVFSAALPDVERPLEAQAQLQAGQVQAGGRTYEAVALKVASRNRALSAEASLGGEAALSLALGGTLDEDGRGLALSALTLSLPKVRWQLARPSHLAFREGVQVAPLTLTAPGQSLSLRAQLQGERLEAALQLSTLQLGLLPRLAVPAEWQLAGTLSGSVSARGSLPRPDVEANLTLSGGGFQQLREVEAALEARYAADRARGTLLVHSPLGNVDSRYDVPVQALLKGWRRPFHLEVSAQGVEVERVLKTLGNPQPLAGTFTGRLVAQGLASDPRLEAEVVGEGLRLTDARGEGVPPLGATLRVKSEEESGALGGRLEVRGLAREAWASVTTPLTLARLRRGDIDVRALLATALTSEARVDALPLELVGRMAGLGDVHGMASLTLTSAGTLERPTGEARLVLLGATSAGRPPVDAALTVSAQPERTVATAEGTLLGQPLLTARAVVEAPLLALRDLEALGRLPVQLEADAGPVSLLRLQHLAAPPVSGAYGQEAEVYAAGEARVVDNPAFPRPTHLKVVQETPDGGQPPFNGVGRAHLSVSGTLNTPRSQLSLALGQMGRGELALGQAEVQWTYANARHTLLSLLTAPSGGTLRLEGSSTLDLSLPALRRGLVVAKAPLAATLVSEKFDLAFLSGVAPMVRQVAGQLQARARVGGTVGAPSLEGQVRWTGGRLALEGYGEYRDVRVSLSGSRDRIVLESLSAQAGAGYLALSGEAVRNGSQYALRAGARAERFPLISEDQLVGVATFRDVTLSGTASREAVLIQKLRIPEAVVELPEVRRKDLQPLEEAGDIILVRNGVPVDRQQQRKLLAERRDNKEPAPGYPVGGSGEQTEAPVRFSVLLDAPRNVWVRGTDVNVELGFSNQFRIEYAQKLLMFGEVRVMRGRVTVLGRAFDLQRDSQVRFTGPANQPFINVAATYTNERENIVVTMNIRGQGKEITLKPTSNPPLSETEIYTLLATGRRNLERNSGSTSGSAAAASVVGSLLATQLKNTLADKLPLDVLSIEAGSEGIQGTRVEVGRYIGDKVYVGYTQRIGAVSNDKENTYSGRVEYQFLPRWSLEGEYGDARVGGLDIIWSKDY